MQRISFQEAHQDLFKGMFTNQNLLHESKLDHGLFKLINLRVSQINQCAYCLDMHYKEAIAAGESATRLSMLAAWEESAAFNAEEMAVLRFAENLTLTHQGALREDIYSQLEHHFDKEEISILTLAVVQINSWNRLMKTFGIPAGKYEVGQYA
ncbi:carboxymuconolactone decarboxylase family protein [Reichenbachiella ulvae]|uniref:Carboxymuconolactone decarboxylase family protein n=1 Tax=Reichenbachiella ulvae TaxID=2980104 RepID=A0ABT3CVT2_9BACT|nr:carboxymuconolactone decarboxylase family protein [Reichenbachiella ulvae]MCV9387737.1 carboxymuconolactone decarboxylase family protein [Reichenbachiella ulvae]